MKINKIKKLTNGKYKLELESGLHITTYDSVILDNNLLYEKNLDDELLDKIAKENNYYNLYNKVMKMVGTKLRSEKEIRHFLEKQEIDNKEVNKLISILKENKIIDDKNFVKAFIHDRFSFSSDGPLKIKQQLEKHNIDENIINEEIEKIDKKLIDEKIEKIVLKRIKTNHKYSNNLLKQKLSLELRTLGYSDFNLDLYFDIHNSNDLIKKECQKTYEKLGKKYSGKELYLKVYQKLYQKGFPSDEINEELNNLGILE